MRNHGPVLRDRWLCKAIHERLLVEFDYKGLHRIVAPYCHGISTRGSEVLRAVQVRGDSSSGGFGFGKLWIVDDMIDLRLTKELFLPNDPTYNPNDSGMREIHCRI